MKVPEVEEKPLVFIAVFLLCVLKVSNNTHWAKYICPLLLLSLIFSSTRSIHYVRSCSQGCAFAVVWPYNTLGPMSRYWLTEATSKLGHIRVTQQIAIELFTTLHHCPIPPPPLLTGHRPCICITSPGMNCIIRKSSVSVYTKLIFCSSRFWYRLFPSEWIAVFGLGIVKGHMKIEYPVFVCSETVGLFWGTFYSSAAAHKLQIT